MSQDHGAEGYKGPEVGLCRIPEMGGSSSPTPCPRHCLSLRFWVLQSDHAMEFDLSAGMLPGRGGFAV